MKNIIKTQKGITLIALVITIVVMLILAGISINLIIGENGIFTKTKEARDKFEIAKIKEEIQLEIISKDLNINEEKGLSQATIAKAFSNAAGFKSFIYEENGYDLKGIELQNGKQILVSDVCNPEEVTTRGGIWNEYKGVNSPQLMEGMTAVYWEDGTEVDEDDEGFLFNDWYSYTEQNWANAKTKDGSYWVWIPRYEYEITSPGEGESSGTIDVGFIPTSQTTVDSDYTYIHPAFKDGTSIGFTNGEWDAEIPGFWVAKYEAGFQEDVDNNGIIKETNKKYTANFYNCNAIQSLTVGNTNMSYPVFKKNKYSYNCINIGDIYTICQEIDGKDIDGNDATTATNFYGLNPISTDSHLMKNSEWGAVAYLTHSKYGRNGTEVIINSYNENNRNGNNKYAKTGYLNGDSSISEMSTGSTSSTGNMTGIFDLSGGCWEYVAAFNSTGNLMSGSILAGEGNNSTEYATKYENGDSSEITPSNYKTGDATFEVKPGTNAWFQDYSHCAYSGSPFFKHGGDYNYGSSAGIFTSSYSSGSSFNGCGFRPVLVVQ